MGSLPTWKIELSLPFGQRFSVSSKEDARRLLDDMVRAAERGAVGIRDRKVNRQSLKDHLTDFESDLRHGIAGKGREKQQPPSQEQVKLVVQRIRDLFDNCGFIVPGDLNDAAPRKVAEHLRERLGKPVRKERGISAQTASFILAARRFARWILAKAPVHADLFDTLPSFDPVNNRRHNRREITPDELARLIDTTRASTKVIMGLTGPDRAMFYLVAFANGYRAGEWANLTPASFQLDGAIPMAILSAQHTKNGKPARQPLPPGLASQLGEYMTGKPTDKPVWPGTWSERPVSVLTRDLKAAKVEYCLDTHEGKKFADFHALRHSYLSALAAAGVGAKELQTLGRHADPRITLGIYTHARPEALGASVARLPLPGQGPVNPLAHLSRRELETAVTALDRGAYPYRRDPASVTLRVTPHSGTSGNPMGLVESRR